MRVSLLDPFESSFRLIKRTNIIPWDHEVSDMLTQDNDVFFFLLSYFRQESWIREQIGIFHLASTFQSWLWWIINFLHICLQNLIFFWFTYRDIIEIYNITHLSLLFHI